MAVNIFDKYGIKEVANVYFEALDDDKAAGVYAGDIVLYLDTLKVSTIETTAENVAAQGGWGNPKLIQWDYGKEINLTLEDALISLESLRFMLGGAIKKPTSQKPVYIHRTAEVVVKPGADADTIEVPVPTDRDGVPILPIAYPNHPIRLINLGGGKDASGNPGATAGTRAQITVGANETSKEYGANGLSDLKFKNDFSGPKTLTSPLPGDHIRMFWVEKVEGGQTDKSSAVEVTISPDTFPGTYKVVGDTFMRSEKTGKDEMFQFVIGKAKVTSDVTITLEAEGDPSTFEMTLNVLRSTNEYGENEMMKLIRYSTGGGTKDSLGDDHGSMENKASS